MARVVAGIAGAIGFIDDRIEAAVRGMTEQMSHRGRDGTGTWRRGSASGVLLAVAGGCGQHGARPADQPLIDEASGDAIAYDGVAYNHPDLRGELRAEGASFQTTEEAESILAGIQRHGAAFTGRIEGMFAFAAWLEARQTLVLARDRLGFRPLYVADLSHGSRDRTTLFASEVRALAGTGLIPRAIDPEGLATYIWNGFVVSPRTLVRGVRSLIPGSLVEITLGTLYVEECRYWELGDYDRVPDGAERVAEALKNSVVRQSRAEAPTAYFLSGGIDSSAVVAMACRAAETRPSTFNIAFDFEEFDESSYARAVADALGTDHHEILITQEDIEENLDVALGALDQPSIDGINTFFVSRAVREAGIRVALGGTGGDDLFGGNRTFVDIPRAVSWGRRSAFLPESSRRMMARVVKYWKTGPSGTVPPQTRWGKLEDVLAARGDVLDLYQLTAAQFTPRFVQCLSPSAASSGARFGIPASRYDQLAVPASTNPLLYSICRLELALFLGERLLRDIDSVSAAAGLEVRSPLLDDALIEAWKSADPESVLLPIGKKRILLDTALSELDPAIFDRPKAGFVMPFERWFRDRLKSRVEEAFSDDEHCRAVGLDPEWVMKLWRAFLGSEPGIYWTRIWAVYCYLWWCRKTGVVLDCDA